MVTDTAWKTLAAALERHPRGPNLTETAVSSFEQRVGFPLPAPLRMLYLALGNGFAPCFLPLFTGREDEKFAHLSDRGEAFRQASEAFSSVLGWHEAHRTLHRGGDDDDVWVPELLLVADFGCAIYFALDLADPNLRMIEYQRLEPSDDPERDAQHAGATLAYTDDRVPPALRLRFTVAAPSLHEWISRWLSHGYPALRAPGL